MLCPDPLDYPSDGWLTELTILAKPSSLALLLDYPKTRSLCSSRFAIAFSHRCFQDSPVCSGQLVIDWNARCLRRNALRPSLFNPSPPAKPYRLGSLIPERKGDRLFQTRRAITSLPNGRSLLTERAIAPEKLPRPERRVTQEG
jgi:hypothetical protein